MKDYAFQYLDLIFKDADITRSKFGIIGGKRKGEKIFTTSLNYKDEIVSISFSHSIFRFLINMFGISEGDVADYIKEYLTMKLGIDVNDVPFHPSI